MAGRYNAKKYRNYMYVQAVTYLPNHKTPDEVYEYVEQNLKPKRMAMILHTEDKKDDNKTPVEPHIHIMLQFENARSVSQLAKDIGDEPERLKIWKGKVENGFSYIIHNTDNSRHKHQYSCDEVRANFDYPAYIEKIAKQVSKVSAVSGRNRINSILDLVATGELSFAEAKNQLSGSDYARDGEKIKKAHELFLERSADELHRQMVDNNEMVDVHWFYGESETGKSYLAETLAKEINSRYYKTTTTTDPFQFYQAEQTIIFDELRPGIIPYSELLALLNPFSRGKITVSSRYFNKALSCKTIFITTPYNPVDFYHGYRLHSTDKGEQLYRRLSSVIKFDMDWIYKMEYQSKLLCYSCVEKKANHYSKKNQPTYILSNVFDRIS